MTRSGLRLALSGVLATLTLAAAAAAQEPIVVASGLDRPRGLAVAPDQTLYAALVGHGGKPCNGEGCFGASGKVVNVTPAGVVTPVVSGLLSMRGRGDGIFSIGADNVTVLGDGRLATAITAEFNGTSRRPPKQVPKGLRPQVGHVVTFGPGGPLQIGANASAPEFAHDPDGEGSVSNPYGIASIGDVIYVSDSAANDLLEVRGGHVRVLTTFPHTSAKAQSVPDALTAGPDGALYVGEFTGSGSKAGTARIWRVVPGQKPKVFARGFTTITALAFGPDRSLYVAEFGPGNVIRLAPDGTRTVLAKGTLHFPGGIAVTGDGSVYVSDWSVAGAVPAKSGPVKGQTGSIVRLP